MESETSDHKRPIHFALKYASDDFIRYLLYDRQVDISDLRVDKCDQCKCFHPYSVDYLSYTSQSDRCYIWQKEPGKNDCCICQ